MAEFIYNQKDIPKTQWRYGLRSSAATGCGWIAVYNALILLGHPMEEKKIIGCLERQVPLIHGNAGTLAFSPYYLFKRWGYRVRLCTKVSEFDQVLEDNTAGILYYYWHSGLRFGSHFIALQQREGETWGYNVYANSQGPDCLGGLTDWIRKQRHFGCVLIGISE